MGEITQNAQKVGLSRLPSRVFARVVCHSVVFAEKTAVLPNTRGNFGVRFKCLTAEVDPVGGCFHALHTFSNLKN